MVDEKKKLFDGTDSVLIKDGWKNSSSNRKHLTFSLRNWRVNNAYLTFFDYTQKREDHDTLGQSVVEAVKYAKETYGTNVFAIVTDNDAKAKAGASTGSDMLKEEGICDDDMFLSTCYSHSANLLIKSIVPKEFSNLLKDIVTAFHSSYLQSCIEDNGGVKLRNYPDTRFCFVRLTIETVWKSLKALRIVAEQNKDKVSENIIKIINDPNFSKQLLDMIRLLDPICKLINRCQLPTVNIAEGTELWLTLKLTTCEFDKELLERLHTAISDVGFAANLVDPRYKGANFDVEGDHRSCAMKFLESHLNDLGKLELARYLEDRNKHEKSAKYYTDSFKFWVNKDLVFPNLSKLCKKLMIIPASTAQLEGLFSQSTYIINKYRNKLSNTSAHNLIDIYHTKKHLGNEVWTNTVDRRKRQYIDTEEEIYMEEKVDEDEECDSDVQMNEEGEL